MMKKLSYLLSIIIIFNLIILLGLSKDLRARAGDFDPSFGQDGEVLINFGGDLAQARAMVLDPEGRILVGGGNFDGTFSQFAVARFLPDGSLDTSFDGDGKVTWTINSAGDVNSFITGIDVIGAPFNRIVAVGTVLSDISAQGIGDNGIGFMYLDFDGNLIGQGVQIFLEPVQANGVAFQSDGKVVAVGQIGDDMALIRWNVNGSLDDTFDGDGAPGDGVVRVPLFGETSAVANALVIQPDGKIVVTGSTDLTAGGQALVYARFNTDGTLDNPFGYHKLFDQGDAQAAAGRGLFLKGDGNIFIVGERQPPAVSYRSLVVVELNPDGSLAQNFNGSGITQNDFGIDSEWRGITVQSNGKIVVGGSIFEGNDELGIVTRLLADGLGDPCWGSENGDAPDFSTEISGIYAVVLQLIEGDKILLAGFENLLFGLGRLLTDDSECNSGGDGDGDGDGDGGTGSGGCNLNKDLGTQFPRAFCWIPLLIGLILIKIRRVSHLGHHSRPI